MRRKAGIGAIQKYRQEQERFQDKGSVIQNNYLEQMTELLNMFQNKLEKFSRLYKNEICKDSKFRKKFQDMCATIGVDPLASSKGFWSELLGIGDFYYELSVQIVEACLAAVPRTGGIMAVDDLRLKLIATRKQSKATQITNDDILQSIQKLNVLGNGITLIKTLSGSIIQCIPIELNIDHTHILALAEKQNGCIDIMKLQNVYKWDLYRCQIALDHLIAEGFVWIDLQNDPTLYWFPGLFIHSIK